MAEGPAHQHEAGMGPGPQQRDVRAYLLVATKGVAMGAADIVPGVSGGTVALITGIYEELLGSIRRLTPGALVLLVRAGPVAFWQHINGNFLLALVLGIGTSIVALAGLIGWLLAVYPIPLWSFFFGLIVYSSGHIWRQVDPRGASGLLLLIAGAASAWLVTSLTPTSAALTPLSLFLAGALAICAMILPGISGSFILVLLGMYAHVIAAIRDFDLVMLAIFAAGCGTGLLGFSHLLGWLLDRYHGMTLALLTGFMLGSLNRVWPWKETLSWRLDHHGEQVPLLQSNVLPGAFHAQTGEDPQLLLALTCFVGGLLLIAGIEQVARRLTRAGGA